MLAETPVNKEPSSVKKAKCKKQSVMEVVKSGTTEEVHLLLDLLTKVFSTLK